MPVAKKAIMEARINIAKVQIRDESRAVTGLGDLPATGSFSVVVFLSRCSIASTGIRTTSGDGLLIGSSSAWFGVAVVAVFCLLELISEL